jgi:DNA-binding CsgD family transcriptional regulator
MAISPILQRLRQTPGVLPKLWDSVIEDPNTYVLMINDRLEILYTNENAHSFFTGDETGSAGDYLGKNLEEVFPAQYFEERVQLFRKTMEDRKVRLVRGIWMGWQYLNRLIPLSRRETDFDSALLVIGRRTPGYQVFEDLLADGEEIIEAEVVNLGPLDLLTSRELEVLALLGRGHSIKEVAKALHRSPKTIENHRMSIGTKLGISDRAELIELARQAGLTLQDAGRTRSRPPIVVEPAAE